MPVFLCRWPNGDFSVVAAPHKDAAIEELDEVANAEGSPMRRMPAFQVHFRLNDNGEIVLEQFGEATVDEIMSFCYPLLEKARQENFERASAEGRDGDPDRATPDEQARITDAVRKERERVKRRPGRTPLTEAGEQIKQQMDAPTSMIDRYIREDATEVLKKMPDPKDPEDVH
jgi:hypothetical protein